MSMADLNKTLDPNVLAKTRLAFIGCGVMAEAIIAGFLKKQLGNPEPIVRSHPRDARRDEVNQKYGVRMFEHNRDATKAVHPTPEYPNSLAILAVKPQRLIGVLHELKGSTHKDQLVVSIVAGAKIATIAEELQHPAIVRTMPNTPAQIGEGITAWTPSAEVNLEQEEQVRAMLEALGKAVCVER